MDLIYTLFKLVHVTSVIVWLGGVSALAVITARLARPQERAALAALLGQAGFYGRVVIAPATGLTLIAGLVMVARAGLGGPLWVTWGMVALVASLVLGATLIRRATAELGKQVAMDNADESRLQALRLRLMQLNGLNLLLLLSAVAAMVFKPTL